MTYVILYRGIVYPILLLSAHVMALFSPKMKAFFQIRKTQNGIFPWLQQKNENTIWVHCSSGELEYAKPILREWKKQYPNDKILLTYFSVSVISNIKNTPEIDLYFPMPWDSPRHWKDFLQHHKPKLLLVARTDVWPEMLYQTHQSKIPSTIFSVTMSDQNAKLQNPIIRSFFTYFYSLFTQIYCVSTEDQKNLQSLGLNYVRVAGDTRYEQVKHRLDHPKPLPLAMQNNKDRTLVLASTWPEDEKEILPQVQELQKDGKQIILVPHETSTEHILSLTTSLESLNLTYQKWSEKKAWTGQNILLVDSVGYLAELYAYASYAFIGGSFKKSVHSVMEALGSGCVVFVGPHHHNNREALEFKLMQIPKTNLKAVNEVRSGQEILEKIREPIKADNNEIKTYILNQYELKRPDIENMVKNLKAKFS